MKDENGKDTYPKYIVYDPEADELVGLADGITEIPDLIKNEVSTHFSDEINEPRQYVLYERKVVYTATPMIAVLIEAK